MTTTPEPPRAVATLQRWCGDAGNGDPLAALTRYFARRTADPDELVQRTLLACLEAEASVRAPLRFDAFVYAVARNEVRMERRRRAYAERRDASLRIDGLLRARVREPPLLGDVVAAEVQRLPASLRRPVELHYWGQLELVEIAAQLCVPVGTIKWRLHRARMLLRQRIRHDA